MAQVHERNHREPSASGQTGLTHSNKRQQRSKRANSRPTFQSELLHRPRRSDERGHSVFLRKRRATIVQAAFMMKRLSAGRGRQAVYDGMECRLPRMILIRWL